MKPILFALSLGLLGACGKSGGDSVTDPKAVYEKQADYTHDMCKCTEGGVDPQACAEKIVKARAPWFEKVKAAMQGGKLKLTEEYSDTMMENTMRDFERCLETARGAE